MRSTFVMTTMYVFILACALFAVEPFLAPPSTSGSMDVKLYPTENVQTGQSVLVTFGVPFTRGSVTTADLAKVRVLTGTQEVAAHVEMLTPWRHTTDANIDGKSVRVACIQILHVFSAAYPQSEKITVEWGKTVRGQDVAALTSPRSAWHLVTTGTFVAADSVWEPDVFAVLPKSVLCQGILKFPRMEPFVDSIAEARDDPSKMSATLHWPDFQEQMYGQKNFFYSIINEDDQRDTGTCRYKTDCEPWLFDRSSSMYVLYFRSGFFKPLREAVRAAGFYYNHMTATGFFDLKAGDDAKYSYNESYAYTYWLTGDDRIKQKIATATLGFNAVRTRWTSTMNFWTERHSGFKLLAHTIAYEVLGGSYKDSMLAVCRDFIWLQNGADGQIPANRIDGGFYHYGAQHDWDWAEDTLGASPWMTMFVMDPALRVYGCSEAQDVGQLIKRMADFLKGACAVTSYNSTDGTKMDFPRYAILFDGRDGQVDEWTDPQHSLEVGAGVACGYYLSTLLGTADSSLKNKAQSLYNTYDDGVNGWIRPTGPAGGLPAYRVSPWRKYNWEYRPSGGLSWMLKPTAVLGEIARPVASRRAGIVRLAGCSVAGRISLDVTVDERSKVTVIMTMLNGRRIGQVSNFDLEAGTHRVSLALSGIGAGVYVLNVNAGGRHLAILANLSR